MFSVADGDGGSVWVGLAGLRRIAFFSGDPLLVALFEKHLSWVFLIWVSH